MDITALLQGYLVGASFIIAIGPQNAFVVSQGLKKQHVFLSAFICTFTDSLLITAGVIGVGALFQSHPLWTEIARWFGAIFLTCYALLSFKASIHPKTLRSENLENTQTSNKKVILVLLSLGLLNPHAYLDTMALIGSISAQQPGVLRYFFGLGAILASATWFFVIAYGARVLTPFFKKEFAWRMLDVIIGVVMLVIALSLIFGKF